MNSVVGDRDSLSQTGSQTIRDAAGTPRNPSEGSDFKWIDSGKIEFYEGLPLYRVMFGILILRVTGP